MHGSPVATMLRLQKTCYMALCIVSMLMLYLCWHAQSWGRTGSLQSSLNVLKSSLLSQSPDAVMCMTLHGC